MASLGVDHHHADPAASRARELRRWDVKLPEPQDLGSSIVGADGFLTRRGIPPSSVNHPGVVAHGNGWFVTVIGKAGGKMQYNAAKLIHPLLAPVIDTHDGPQF